MIFLTYKPIFLNSYLQFIISFSAVWKWIMGLPKQLKSRSFRGAFSQGFAWDPPRALQPPASFSGFQVWATFTPACM